MKIALCFYGLVGGAEGNDGKGFTLSPVTAAHYYKKNIIDNNENVDIFLEFEKKNKSPNASSTISLLLSQLYTLVIFGPLLRLGT